MAQLSRPFQALLVAFCLLAAVWFFAVHGRSATTTSPPAPATSTPGVVTAPSAAPASSAEAEAKAAATPSHVYHGPVPGLEGLTRDINKAHGAVATSQQNAQQLEQKSAEASGSSPAPTSAATVPAHSAPAASSEASSVTVTRVKRATSVTGSTKTATGSATILRTHAPVAKHAARPALASRQASVEAQLARGDTVLLLFWNPRGADDVAVRSEVRRAAAGGHGRIVVQEALASEVAAFGSITRGVQIYGTPTLLVIDKAGRASTLTGFIDTFAIQQAIEEAHSS